MSAVLLGFVGDVLVNRENPGEVFGQVRHVLGVPQVLFGNLEGVYTNDPHPMQGAPSIVSAPAHNINVYAQAGFDVLSLANNHVLDVGYDAMLETRSRLRSQGIQTCGAGDSLEDARKPAIVEVDGLRIAFLAYASIFPHGYEARSNRPGLAPLRAHNSWREPFATMYTPGLAPIISTIPDETDLARLSEDIQRARRLADLVVTSFHWGDHTRPFHLTDHEIRSARLCIDEGAHLVVGHHHHALRGMEWYKGRPIMYGLGHFVFDFKWGEEEVAQAAQSEMGRYFKQIHFMVDPHEGWTFARMSEDTRMTVMAWALAGPEGIIEFGFLPCRLASDGVVHPLQPNSPEGRQVVSYLERCNLTQGLKTHMTTERSMSIAGFKTMRFVPGE
jgi:poly-gamma-glutamate capsule biosynthesis protein CapA/YwtB (metallophosphatase superfamily)